MKIRSVTFSLLFMFIFASQNTYAVLINTAPPSEYIVTTSNQLEWVYAAPVSPIWTTNTTYLPQELHGFTVATAADFSDSFLSFDDLIQQFSIPNSTFSGAKCAASYFTDSDFCNGGDVHLEAIWQNPWNVVNGAHVASETFMVRGSSIEPEPELVSAPATLALFGLGLIAFGFVRRKKG